MLRKMLFACCFYFSATVHAQNLVIDGGLEDTLKCPQTIGRFYHPTNTNEQYTAQWRSTTLASPDYHNVCGYSTYEPRSGRGYAGILYYDPSEYREYITALLSQPLVNGQKYYVEYHVALNAGSTKAINELQVHFSSGTPLDMTFPPPGPLALAPHLQAGVAPTDTLYQRISGCYIANGGEDAVTFGNFYNNANTSLTTVSSVGAVNAYYFIDDVSVIAFNSSITLNNDTLIANMDSVSYQWLNCGNGFSPIAGETNQLFIPSAAGSYAVEVSVGGCADTSACYSVSFSTLNELPANDKTLIRIIDPMGRETHEKPNTLLIYIYSDGTKEKVFRGYQ